MSSLTHDRPILNPSLPAKMILGREGGALARKTYYTSPDDNAESRLPRAEQTARRINAQLLKRGWRQSDLARAAEKFLPKGKKFGRQLISSYCRGVHMPTPLHLDAMARAFGVPIDELVPDSAATFVGRPEPAIDMQIAGDTATIKLDMTLPVDIALEIARLARSAMPK